MQALEDIDVLVGELRTAAERAGNGRAIFVVVSDHGHVRATRDFRLNEALRAAGLILLNERGRPTGWKARAWGSGGSAAVMLADPSDEATRRAVQELLERYASGPDAPIQRILDAEAARAAGGFPDAAFVVGVKADTRITTRMEGPILGPGLPEGGHGHLPENPEMDASFFIVGPGVPAGRDLGRVDMRDIAPTLGGLLGLKLPNPEGRDLLGSAAGQAPTKATASTSTAKP
jgi:predicted AlkP superfamily pyrophosphatase or phosphodiesterase